MKHIRSADGQEVKELIFESARAPPLRARSPGLFIAGVLR